MSGWFARILLMDQNKYIKDLVIIFCFCTTIFLGAFLLFQIEPTIGKIVTPLYGGTASVWTVCLLFFQSVVLAGYALTFIITKLPLRTQFYVYLSLFSVSVFWSKIPPSHIWQQNINAYEPISSLLTALTIHAAIPCILLATVSGIMQFWFGIIKLGNPYPLYSVSNIGSILALLSYPTLVEPFISTTQTLQYWSWLYCLLGIGALVCAFCVWFRMREMPQEESVKKPVSIKESVNVVEFAKWLFFSTMGSVVLLAYSSFITSEVSAIPLLWVLPLAIYLLTFVLAFSNKHFYRRNIFLNTWMFIGIFTILAPLNEHISYLVSLIACLLLIFFLCMICHGELYNRKPALINLPIFYLAIAIGGALGGVFVGIIAPTVFKFEVEYFLVIGVMGLFTVYEVSIKKFRSENKKTLVRTILILLTGAIIIALLKLEPPNYIYRDRNFYSSARVVDEGDYRIFYHGYTDHGRQFLDPAKADLPAGYYWPPIGLIMDFLHVDRRNTALSLGGIGLGVGVFSIYGRLGDTIVFYELDPKVEKIARCFFTYLSRSKAKIEIHIGDGRNVLSGLPEQNYDLFLIDAFNSDAIPCHLITEEAILMYLEHLKQDGLLVFHLTNRYAVLPPVLGNLFQKLRLSSCRIQYLRAIDYVVVSKNPNSISKLVDFAKIHQTKYPYIDITKTPTDAKTVIWTDDHVSPFSVLKLHL